MTGEGSDTGPAELLVSEIRANGGEAAADANSVATPEGGAAIVATAMDNFGRVDIVVNNAGILRDKMFEDMTMDLVDPVLDVHLKGAFNVTRPAFAIMQRQGYGRIVSTCSASGILGSPSKANYAAAKTGLIGLTRVLAAEGGTQHQGERLESDRLHPHARALAGRAGSRRTTGSRPRRCERAADQDVHRNPRSRTRFARGRISRA